MKRSTYSAVMSACEGSSNHSWLRRRLGFCWGMGVSLFIVTLPVTFQTMLARLAAPSGLRAFARHHGIRDGHALAARSDDAFLARLQGREQRFAGAQADAVCVDGERRDRWLAARGDFEVTET